MIDSVNSLTLPHVCVLYYLECMANSTLHTLDYCLLIASSSAIHSALVHALLDTKCVCCFPYMSQTEHYTHHSCTVPDMSTTHHMFTVLDMSTTNHRYTVLDMSTTHHRFTVLDMSTTHHRFTVWRMYTQTQVLLAVGILFEELTYSR